MDTIEHISNAIAVLVSVAALAINLRRRHLSRVEELRRIGEESVLIAKAKAVDGLSVERLALETAILLDIQQDGKRDYTRQQLWGAVQAALARGAAK